MDVALSARASHHDLLPYQLQDQRAGSIIGRLALGGQKNDGLSMAQYEAAQRYEKDRKAYLKATGSILPPEPKAMDLNRIYGKADQPENEKKITGIVRHWTMIQSTLREAAKQSRNSNLFQALEIIIIQDRDIGRYRGDLRIALNALSKLYSIPEMEEA